jgi:hypothetical protein
MIGTRKNNCTVLKAVKKTDVKNEKKSIPIVNFIKI